MNIVIFVLAAATVLNTIYIVALRNNNELLWKYLNEHSKTIKTMLDDELDILNRQKNIVDLIKDLTTKK